MSQSEIAQYAGMLGVLVFLAFLSRRLVVFLLVPMALGVIRFVGEVLQEAGWGPLWAQHHLGDVGIVAHGITWGFMLALAIAVCKEGDRVMQLRTQTGMTWRFVLELHKRTFLAHIPATFFVMSLAAFVLALAADFLTAFAPGILGGEAASVHYSREFDWPDALAYTTGLAAMILNHRFVGVKVQCQLQYSQ